MSHRLYIRGDITTQSFGEFQEAFHGILDEDAVSKIVVYICSEGGSAEAALAYHDLIRTSKIPITMLGTGIIASAAALIFAAGHTRYMTPNAWLMVHDESVADTTNLRVHQVEKHLAHQRVLENQWNSLMYDCIPSVSEAEWDQLHRNETYLTAKECKAMGIINGIQGADNESES